MNLTSLYNKIFVRNIEIKRLMERNGQDIEGRIITREWQWRTRMKWIVLSLKQNNTDKQDNQVRGKFMKFHRFPQNWTSGIWGKRNLLLQDFEASRPFNIAEPLSTKCQEWNPVIEADTFSNISRAESLSEQ